MFEVKQVKQLTFRLIIAVVTFLTGVSLATFYVVRLFKEEGGSQQSHSLSCFPGNAVRINAANTQPTSYFPVGMFSENAYRDQFLAKHYSKNLSAMAEPSLLSSPGNAQEGYRFLWLRTFDKPVAIRLWRSGREQHISIKKLDGAGGYEPGDLIDSRSRPLTDAEWLTFTSLLERTCFWNLKSADESEGTDGSQWIIEGAKEGYYHIVDRHSPKGGDYRELGLYLLRLADLNDSGVDAELG